MRENLPFDDYVRSQFSNFEPEVPDRIWDKIIAEKKRRRGGFWTPGKTLLLVSILLVSGISGYFLLRSDKISSEIAGNDSKPALTTGDQSSQRSTSDQSTTSTGISDTDPKQPVEINTNEAEKVNKTSDVVNQDIRSTSANNKQSQTKTTAISSNNKTTYNRPQKDGNVLNSDAPVDQDVSLNDVQAKKDKTSKLADSRAEFMKNFIAQNDNSKKLSLNKNVTNAPKLKLPDCPTIEKNAAGNKKYLEAYVGPDYAFSRYKTNGDTGSSAYAQKRKDATVFASAFSAGVRYTKVFNNGMSVRAGANFSQINEKFKYVNPSEIRYITVITTRVIIRAPGDTIYVNDTLRYQQNGTRVKTTANRFRSIDIPITVGYELGNGKLHANINAGAIINLYSWYKGDVLDTLYQPVSITTGKGNTQYQYKTNIGVGFISSVTVYYKLNDKWHVLVEPYFRYNLSPMSKENLNFQQRYHTAGIRAGIRLDLGQRNQ